MSRSSNGQQFSSPRRPDEAVPLHRGGEDRRSHVVKACDQLEVSRSAYYLRRNGAPSVRSVTDTELTEKIKAIHAESKGTYG